MVWIASHAFPSSAYICFPFFGLHSRCCCQRRSFSDTEGTHRRTLLLVLLQCSNCIYLAIVNFTAATVPFFNPVRLTPSRKHAPLFWEFAMPAGTTFGFSPLFSIPYRLLAFRSCRQTKDVASFRRQFFLLHCDDGHRVT